MKRQLVTAGALLALAATALAGVHATTQEPHIVCIPLAVIQALS